MPTVIDPIDGFLREEGSPAEHDWSKMTRVCTRCDMTMEFYMDTQTSCVEKEIMPD